MPRYRVKVFSERTCWDYAFVEVEARNATDARNAAMTLAEAGDAEDWMPAESETYETTGRFDVGRPEEIPNDEA